MRWITFSLVLAALWSCNLRNDRGEPSPSIVGKWTVVQEGVDDEGEPCPFIPDEMEFFADGTVEVSILPGRKMLYKIVTDADELARVAQRFAHAKPGRTLMMMLSTETDWVSRGMAYGYELRGDALVLEFPGWSPSTFARAE